MKQQEIINAVGWPRGLPMDDVDDRVRALVAVLNAIPGVSTYSSCGGHEGPKECQRPPDEWYVGFDVRQTREGWRALGLIVRVVDIYNEEDSFPLFDFVRHRVKLEPWMNGDGDESRGLDFRPDLLSWELSGVGQGVEPDGIAQGLALFLPHVSSGIVPNDALGLSLARVRDGLTEGF